MDKIPIWKRVGGWLRRSPVKMEGEQVERLDPESLLLNHEEGKEAASTLVQARPAKKEHPLTAMEEGFGRLVEVLESLNHNVVMQREQGAEISSRLMEVVELTKAVPDAIQSQTQLVRNINESIGQQSEHSRQLVELIRTLPELTRDQLDKLGYIHQQLENTADSNLKMAGAMGRVDNTIQDMMEHSRAQSMSLKNIGEVIVQGDSRVAELLARQNRRFAWIIGLLMLASLLVIGGVVLFFVLRTPAS